MKWGVNNCSCGSVSKGIHVFVTRDFNFNTTAEKCAVLRCSECGSLYPEKFPTLESLQDAYANYYISPRHRYRHSPLLRRLIDLTRAQYMLRGTPGYALSILDYGCGSGEFLSSLKHVNVASECYGTDLFKPCEVDNKDFEWLPLEQFDEANRRYDWITMSHVIEHLASVDPVLSRLAKVISNDGSIWISTPNADSLLIRYFKGYARDIDFPRHRLIYSKNSLKEQLNRMGFNVHFLSEPRINVIINFSSCVKNVWKCEELPALEKILVIMSAGIRVTLNLTLPQRFRIRDAAELVLVASPTWH